MIEKFSMLYRENVLCGSFVLYLPQFKFYEISEYDEAHISTILMEPQTLRYERIPDIPKTWNLAAKFNYIFSLRFSIFPKKIIENFKGDSLKTPLIELGILFQSLNTKLIHFSLMLHF